MFLPSYTQKEKPWSNQDLSSLLWFTNLCLGLSVISFRSSTLRQVSCYTFLSGFQPSWPPTCYLQHTTSFVVSDEPFSFGTVSKLSVHPASPALLTSDGPLRALSILCLYALLRNCVNKSIECVSNFAVWEKVETDRPSQKPLIHCSTGHNWSRTNTSQAYIDTDLKALAILRETSKWTSY